MQRLGKGKMSEFYASSSGDDSSSSSSDDEPEMAAAEATATTDRGLTLGMAGAAASVASSVYGAYIRAQGNRYPLAVSIGWERYGNTYACSACVVAPVHASVVWLRKHLATEYGVETSHLRFSANQVRLNDDDDVFDVCRHLKPHRFDDMLEAVLVEVTDDESFECDLV